MAKFGVEVGQFYVSASGGTFGHYVIDTESRAWCDDIITAPFDKDGWAPEPVVIDAFKLAMVRYTLAPAKPEWAPPIPSNPPIPPLTRPPTNQIEDPTVANPEIFDIVMDEVMHDVINQLKAARARPDVNMEENDASHNRNDWIALITSYVGDAADGVFSKALADADADQKRFEDKLIKVAGLAISAVVLSRTGYC
jgi:hypothetical protein